ncbi:MAG: hypothetical protein ACXV3C_14815, partial [Actinomycetes bacterium]
ASCMRGLLWGHLPPAGVLASRRTRVLVVLLAPVVVLLRLVRPKTRPVLEVVARRPDGPA